VSEKTFKPYPDGGALHATQSKRSPKSADYFGEIAINLKDNTNVRIEDGLHIFKINGWKKVGPSGKTYLSISVSRYVPEDQAAPKVRVEKDEMPDDDIPF
jgi:hypothetical protein